MSVWRRAVLHVKREWNKSLFLFLLFLILSSFLLSGLTIRNATVFIIKKLRENVGAEFRVEGSSSNNLGDELIKKIMSGGGIRDFNGQNTFYLAAKDLVLEPGHYAGTGEIWEKVPKFISNTKSQLNPYFSNKQFVMTQGRHIMPDDDGKIAISENLANYNNLYIGDTISVTVDEEFGKDNKDAIGKTLKLKITGIFKIAVTQDRVDDTVESELPENFIFTDNKTGHRIYELLSGKKSIHYRSGVSFYVKDPKELDKIIKKLQARKDINLNSFKVIKNNKKYEELAAPLENLNNLVKIMVSFILMIGILLLTFILTLWIRERIYEVGIYLSIGSSKLVIFSQFLLEFLLIALISFVFSYTISVIISEQLWNFILRNISVLNLEKMAEEIWSQSKEINTTVGILEFLAVLTIEILVILLTVSISFFSVIRLNPRDILAKMN
ncbi:ABC transporter permease [Anaerosacchariphilus polymeriproducens]|uniref:ABC3 transporter permease C-terminal domain-containing protein n=1 Tax=Anaerosacchariphilus polymeriproducens TaxID=1812858 RepID=A0A371ASE3_9FIRM|nr:ABC transporter permease [Anaerosacchariphilus polymeriproducens]RDU22487.1 hypothetical protein DWV06_14455 [Anaerosacchariphilus polymeriproducens]